MTAIDLVWMAVSFLLTLMVFSYILGDNPLFRLAVYLFIGVTAGYAAAVAIHNVIIPQLITPLLFGSLEQRVYIAFPLLLSALLLLKISPRLAPLGNPAMAYLVGVGVATAIGGALLGTLFPQTLATINLGQVRDGNVGSGLVEALIIIIGVVTTLAYFHFGARPQVNRPPRQPALVETLSVVGGGFIALTLGVIFAGVYSAALTALIERSNFLIQFVQALMGFITQP
jgi:hypothetical protein